MKLLTTKQKNFIMIIKLISSFLNDSKENNNLYFGICNFEECINKYNKDFILFTNKLIVKFNEVEFLKSKETSIDLLKKFLIDKYIYFLFDNNISSIFYVRNSSIETQTLNIKLIIELGKKLREKNAFYTLELTNKH